MLADLGDAIELVLRNVFRQPVAAVVGEVELLVHRIPVEAHRVAHAQRDYFGAGAVKIDTADLAMLLVMQDVVARLAYLQVELVVGTDAR